MRSGTITVPPPTPKSPLKTPAAEPIRPSIRISRRRATCTGGDTRSMTSRTAEQRQAAILRPLLEAPRRSAVLTDVDGTLAPIVERPEMAAVPEATQAALARLRDRFAVVGCISGRRAPEVRELVGVEGIAYAGNHGLELLLPGDDEPRIDPSLRDREDA